MRRYGAALIGAGAAIAYLALWAATRLYGFLPAAGGIATLGGVSLWLALIAYLIDIEWLGATAAAGGLLAPIFLGAVPLSGDLFLAYLAAMALGLGWVASLKRWRYAAAILALASFGLLPAVWDAGGAHATSYVLFGAVVGGAGVYLGLRERWRETRFLAFAGGWAALGCAAWSAPTAHLPVVLGAVVLSVPVWRLVWEAGTFHAGAAAEALYFFVTPALLVFSVRQVDPGFFDGFPGLATVLVAAAYLVAGYVRARPPFGLAGALLLVVATLQPAPGVWMIWMLLGQAALWAALDHPLGRTDGRWHSLLPLGAALMVLLSGGASTRPMTDPAFTGIWAAALWAAVATVSGLALGLWKRDVDPSPRRLPVREGLWCAAGGLLFVGVTSEIVRFFAQSGLPAETKALAGGLLASAWWLAFAAGLVVVGFRKQQKPVRVAGLFVAGLAAIKVVLVDLSSLDALYRVASILILGVVSLGIAYLYNRKADPA